MKKFILEIINTIKKVIINFGLILVISIIVAVIASPALDAFSTNKKLDSDNYNVNKLSYEEKYKVQCGSRQNYEIISAFNPEFYFDEQISVVGRIVGIEDNSTYNNKSGHIYNSSNHTIYSKNTDLIYYISDEGLSDGGGIWKFRSVYDSFKVGDMVIVYGTGAIAQYDPDSVLLTVKYMDFYKE